MFSILIVVTYEHVFVFVDPKEIFFATRSWSMKKNRFLEFWVIRNQINAVICRLHAMCRTNEFNATAINRCASILIELFCQLTGKILQKLSGLRRSNGCSRAERRSTCVRDKTENWNRVGSGRHASLVRYCAFRDNRSPYTFVRETLNVHSFRSRSRDNNSIVTISQTALPVLRVVVPARSLRYMSYVSGVWAWRSWILESTAKMCTYRWFEVNCVLAILFTPVNTFFG